MKTIRLALLLALPFGALHILADTSASSSDTEEMVVVASRLPVDQQETGRAVTVLNQTAIHDAGYAYAADLFRLAPGVAVSRTGGYAGATQLRLRGAEANHVLVLIDGIDVSAAGTGEFDFSSLLSADLERIELLRGPQSGLYGSNAMAGVISIHTRSPEPGFSVNGNLELGDDHLSQQALSIGGGNERITGRISLVQRESEFDLSDHDDAGGGEDDNDLNRTISGQLRVQASQILDIRLVARRTERDTDTDGFDFTGGPQQGLAIDDNSFSDTEDQTLGATATLRLADGRSITHLALERTDAETNGGTFGNESQRQQIRFDSSWWWPPQGSVRQRTTVFLQQEEESYRNLMPFDPSQAPTIERDLLGYGIEHRLEIDDTLFLTGTVRQDDNDKFKDAHTYSLDASFRPDGGDTRLHASYGTGVTNPTFFEQFGFIPGTFVGNPDLKPERSRGWDAGIEQSMLDGQFIMDVTYFKADLENEIQSLFPSVVNTQGQSRRSGAEVSFRFVPGTRTSVHASYTYTDADEPGGREVRRPRHTGSLSLARSMLDGRARVGAAIIFNGEQFDTDYRNYYANGFVAERTELDSYALMNLNASYALTDAIEIYLRMENLLDEGYDEVLGYATPGRTAMAGIRFRFDR